MDSPIDRFLRAMAGVVVRGPDAPYVLGDLEEGLRRDVERGLSPWRARLRFVVNAVGSGLSLTRGSGRSRASGRARRRRWAGPAWLDVKLSLRMLRRYPGLSVVSVIGMAVAIAIGAGYFSALGAMLETELPIPGGDRMVSMRHLNVAEGEVEASSVRDLVTWREELESVEEVGAFRVSSRNLIRADGATEIVSVAAITTGGLRQGGAAPILGRALVPEDERPGAPDVLLLGYDEWQRVFDGAPGVIGETVRLGEAVHTVVGVMPPGFRFPLREQYWIPLRVGVGEYGGGGPSLHVFGRLAEGVSMARARSELESLGARLAAESPGTYGDLRPQLLPYTHAFIGIETPEMQLALRALQLLVGGLLLVVAINVAVLVYARTATRLGEIAVRSALGASRRRIVGQLFIEAGVLAIAAAVLGLTIARAALGVVADGMGSSTEARPPFWIDFTMSWTQVLYVVALALVASLVVGVIPALKVTGKRLDALKEYAARGAGLQLGRTWTALIVVQVAIAVAALPPALNYAAKSLRLGTRAPGSAAQNLLRATLVPPEDGKGADELVRRLEAEAEVVGVTYARGFPGVEPSWGRLEMEGGGDTWVRSNTVAINLFDVFEVPVIAGRGFTAADATENATAVIVDDVLAEHLGGGNVLGRHVRYGPDHDDSEPGPWYEIVGVVSAFAGDFTTPNTFDDPYPRIFHPVASAAAGTPALVVRVAGNPAAFARRIPDLAASIDPTMRVERLMPVVHKWDADQNTFFLMALGIAITMASVLLLSAAGIYAMMSFTVTRRRREIGIRTALGANGTRVLAGIFRRAGAQLGAGVAAGLALTLAIEIGSPGSILGGNGLVLVPVVIAVLLMVGLGAALGPARRGLSVQPTEMLRDGG